MNHRTEMIFYSFIMRCINRFKILYPPCLITKILLSKERMFVSYLIDEAVDFFSTYGYLSLFSDKRRDFLALLQQEYELWNHDLQKLYDTYEKISIEDFASEIAGSLENRTRFLKLMSHIQI